MDSLFDKALSLEQLMPLIRECLDQGKTVTFSPRGTSMLPMLRQGIDRVVLAAAPEKLKKYDIPLYQRKNGQYVLHRIVKAGQTYTCMGDNQFAPEPGLGRDQVIAVAVAFYRGERRYDLDGFACRCYCRLWHYSRPARRCYRRLRSLLGRLLV